ncbi:MAG TPA: hypothetical protein VFQ53_16575 [Kofleriaceae bacterium]|nr:hypothetical protein [Kofleriaceae bacterium]
MARDRDPAFPKPRGGRLVTGCGTTERSFCARRSRPDFDDEPTDPDAVAVDHDARGDRIEPN